MKLKLFWKQLENVNLCNFSSCDLLHQDGPVSVPFPHVCAVEMTDSLAENFKMRFSDFHSHSTNICIFENPFSVDVSDAVEKLYLEFTEQSMINDSCHEINLCFDIKFSNIVLFCYCSKQ
jgi:hypothetical protein